MGRSALNRRALEATFAAGILATGVGVLVTSIRLLPAAWTGGGSWLSPLVWAGALMAGEASLLLVPALGWAMALARLSDQGELRALQALGTSPGQLATRTAPALAIVMTLGLVVSFLWGGMARAPGAMVGRVIDEARVACAADAKAAARPAVADLPMLEASWVCFPSGDAWAVGGGAASSSPVYAARELALSADLSTFFLTDAVVTSGARGGSVRLSASHVRIVGMTPSLSRSNLAPHHRAILVATTSGWLAWLGCWLGAASLARRRAQRRARAVLLSSAASGGAAALLTFSSIEAAPSPLYMYVAVPLTGTAALVLAHGVWLAAFGVEARRSLPSPAEGGRSG